MKTFCGYIAGILAFILISALPVRAEISESDCILDKDCVLYYAEIGDEFEVLRMLRDSYVDPVDFGAMVEARRKGGLKAVFELLDPHSYYLPPELAALQRAAEDRKPFGGVGMVLSKSGTEMVVEEVIGGGPAEIAGVMEADVIAEVCPVKTLCEKVVFDEKAAPEASQEYFNGVVGKIRGEPGSELTLRLRREGSEQFIEVTMKRAMVKAEDVTFKVFGDVGYVKVRVFEKGVSFKIKKIVERQMPQNLKGLALDLRGNPGGLFFEANLLAALFLPKNNLIVKVKSRTGTEMHYSWMYKTADFKMPLIVLVDGASASASEIVAEAIRKNNRGVVIGLPTFGKAIMQTKLGYYFGNSADDYWSQITKGGMFQYTIARLYGPDGKSIQGKGTIPDIIVSKEGDDIEKMMRDNKRSEQGLARHLKGEEEGVITPEEQAKFRLLKKDRQLQLALEVVKVINKGSP